MRIYPLLALVPLVLAASGGHDHGHVELATAPQSFVNTAVARTIELGGSTTLVTTQYNVKALVDDPGVYVLALGGQGDVFPAWYEVLVAGKPVDDVKIQPALGHAPAIAVPVGTLKKDETVTISLNALLAHLSSPLPAAIEQRDPQYFLWETNSTYVDSVYTSDVERIKIRSPSPNIVNYSKVPTVYTRDADVTKSASTLTLGPFHSVPPTVGSGAKKAEQQPFSVHYETRDPVMGIRELKRSAEVSHWGANLNIQEEISLFNDGPKLKGQFSRLAHQQSKYHGGKPPQVFSDITLRLPPSAHSVYYYDVIGNVSTSRFRPGSLPTSSRGRSPRVVDGLLELRPRYPILGGWNYSFTIGWDSPLGDALKVEKSTGKQILAVPFSTTLKDVVIDNAELKIVLPEGATDVEVFTPFAVDSIEHSVHKTYLDTTGRPVVTIQKRLLTENHSQPVFITYEYPLSAQMQKPLAVAAVAGSLLILFMVLRRVDYSIENKKKK